jgi:hypothetical protein
VSLPDKPEPTVRDRARTAGNAAVAAIPFVGGPAGILLDAVIRPGYEKRLDAWLEQLGAVVQDLESRTSNLDISALGDNELFVTAVIDASRIALTTSLEAKILMLKAALVNIAEGQMTDDFLALRYLHFVEELAPEHFRMLSYGAHPGAWHPQGMVSDAATPRALIDTGQLNIDPEIVDVLLADLAARGLIDTTKLFVVVDGDGALGPFTTRVGAQLVDFVKVFE